jgi:hypothetical protein
MYLMGLLDTPLRLANRLWLNHSVSLSRFM